MKNKRANLSCVRTVLLQAGKGHAARTTIKQNNKTNISKMFQQFIDRIAFKKKNFNENFILKNIIRLRFSLFNVIVKVILLQDSIQEWFDCIFTRYMRSLFFIKIDIDEENLVN